MKPNIFDRELNKIISKVEKLTEDVAQEAYKQVVNFSPSPDKSAGWSKGSYILSHRVSANGKPDTSTTVLGVKDATARAQATTPKPIKVTLGTDVIISNSTHYSEDVEFIGWKFTGPYHPYASALGIVNLKAMTMAAQI